MFPCDVEVIITGGKKLLLNEALAGAELSYANAVFCQELVTVVSSWGQSQ